MLFSQPITKGAADDAISRITEKFAARQTAPASQAAAVEKSDDEKTEKTLADFFKEICAQQPFDYDKLAKQSVTLEMKTTKPVEKMTLADYIQAKDRAIYKQAGYGMLTDAEIRAAADMVAAKFPVHNTNFGLDNLHKLDALAGAMTLTTNRATIEYAVRAGQAMLQYRDYQAKAIDDAVEKGKDYVNGALGGFIEKPYNAVVNNVNGLSEPFRAGEQRIFGTSYLPELPRSTVGDRSEYWQQKRYGNVSLNMIGEGAATIQVGIMTGKPLYSSRLGALLGLQVGAYNIGVCGSGNDPLHPGRQMSGFERGSRIVGGTLGAASAPFSPGGRAFANDALAFPNAARNTVRNLDEVFRPPSNPPLAPAGNVPGRFGTRIFTNKTPIQKMGEPMEISISADEANLDHITSGKKPPYGATRARDIVLDKETVFVRVHGEDNQTRFVDDAKRRY